MAESCSNWKALADRAAGIEEDADAEGQICLLSELEDRDWRARHRRADPKFSWCRPVMKWPFLSVTVKIWLTSSVSTGGKLEDLATGLAD